MQITEVNFLLWNLSDRHPYDWPIFHSKLQRQALFKWLFQGVSKRKPQSRDNEQRFSYKHTFLFLSLSEKSCKAEKNHALKVGLLFYFTYTFYLALKAFFLNITTNLPKLFNNLNCLKLLPTKIYWNSSRVITDQVRSESKRLK